MFLFQCQTIVIPLRAFDVQGHNGKKVRGFVKKSGGFFGEKE